ncbi:MAG: response regulator, partial [Deltaproteobacteria bacterium]
MNASLMIVDDAKDQIYLMHMLMKTIAPDITILTACDGDEAIRQLRDALPNLPRLILMDLKL